MGITDATSFIVTGLQPGMTYRFIVLPLNEYGDGPSKAIVVSTTGGKQNVKTHIQLLTLGVIYFDLPKFVHKM